MRTELSPRPLQGKGPLLDSGGHESADATEFDSEQEAFVSMGRDGRLVFWDRAAETTFGWSRSEAIGRPLTELIVPESHRGAHERALRNYLETPEAATTGRRLEFEAQHRDGDERPVELRIAPASIGDGTVFNAFLYDVSRRRAGEAAVQLLAGIVESSDDAIVARDPDGTVRSWNAGAERLLGYSAAEMVGRSIAPVWREERELFEAMQARLAAGERVPSFDARAVRGDGRVIDVSVTASALKDADGRPTGVAVIFRDISARKRAEQAADEARRRFDHAFEEAPIGMAIVSPDGGWVAVNPSLCRLLGREHDELLETTFQDVTHPDDLDSDLEQRRQALAGGVEGYDSEKRYLRPDGSVVWAQVSTSLVRDHNGEPLYFISQLQDVSERRQAEEELARYTAHLTELAHVDPLTGLRNYRDFHGLLDAELERSRRYDSDWSVVLMDVDGFRQLNATEGHIVGDRVLREVAAVISQASRGADLVARIGSDEFALILPGTTGDGAQRTAERIAEAAASRGVSLSWGTACWPDDGDSKELVLVRADMQLSAAKLPQGGSAESSTPGSRPGRLATNPAIRRLLALAREQLGMDVVYLTEIDDEGQTFRATEGDAESFAAAEGLELPLDETVCNLMLDGRVPQVIPDVAAQPLVCDLPIAHQAGLGSYLGVPVQQTDGRLFGTLCGASHGPTEGLGERELQLVRFLAGLVADEIERVDREADARRAQAELTGIDALLSALLARDHYTGEHSQTVVRMAIAVARHLGLESEQVAEIEQVALLHDIGKVGVPDSILQKRGPLNDQEWELMRQHPAIGARILSGTETLSHLAPAVKAEHERYDGEGYPDGLRGEQIPLASRITLACDAFHAMTRDRPYRSALTVAAAREQLRLGAGSQFDPDVVEALLAIIAAGSAHWATSPGEESSTGAGTTDVLAPSLPRQTPVWEPSPGSTAPLGNVRAICVRCGTHTSAIVSQATMSGRCGNCGSYELGVLEI